MPGKISTIAGLLLATFLSPTAVSGEDLLLDVTTSSGLDFVHFNGMSGKLYFIEMMGGGGALFDYDRDGDLDAYLVQGHMLGEKETLDDALFPPVHHGPMTDRLYRNDSETTDGETKLRFTDVTAESGINSTGYGMGVASGDIDNDGYPDLYVMNYGSNVLWRNLGNGRFEDITDKAGVDDARWSVSASFVDIDRDGLLDLYVANYLKHDITKHKICRMSKRVIDYCGPSYNAGETDRLFRNLGNGRFEDISGKSGIEKHSGGALGVIAADFNDDDWVDLYIANDGVSNLLWINQHDGTFVDEALLGGVAVNRDGMAEGSMGVDAQDYDGDGDNDIFITHFDQETNTLYVNDGSGWFEDESVASGLGNPSFQHTGFGAAWLDLDNDGWLDLYTVNGAVKKKEALVLAGDPYPLHETNQLFLGDASGAYRDVSARAGAALGVSQVSRGAAFGDVDNDGDSDILVANNAGKVQLLLNATGQDNNWLGLVLQTETGRDALGAVATLIYDDDAVLVRRSRSDGSYASANDPRVLFGLGDNPVKLAGVEVLWSDGARERWHELPVRRYHTLRQGSGKTLRKESFE